MDGSGCTHAGGVATLPMRKMPLNKIAGFTQKATRSWQSFANRGCEASKQPKS